MTTIWKRISSLDDKAKPFIRAIQDSATGHLAAWIVAFGTALSIVFTTIQVLEDLSDRREERQVRKEERHERAFSRLLMPADGNIGKGRALMVLAQGDALPGSLDLSCELRGRWDSVEKRCVAPPIFSDIELSTGRTRRFAEEYLRHLEGGEFVPYTFNILGPLQLEGEQEYSADADAAYSADIRTFAGATIEDSSFSGNRISGDIFSGTRVETSSFENALIGGLPDQAHFSRCDLTGSLVFEEWGNEEDRATVRRFTLTSCNLSGAILVNSGNNTSIFFPHMDPQNPRDRRDARNWFWADNPPRLSDGKSVRRLSEIEMQDFRICDPKKRPKRPRVAKLEEYFAATSQLRFVRGVTEVMINVEQQIPNEEVCSLSFKVAAARYPNEYNLQR
ncbi:pentapeptide repeat-containing protein [Rhizobium rhizophilum]|uniref:Pentapeptide repeat-containing protein n=1 Tax=Rhizobium rhizophilum TaxID=1850373 RepID=A0ABY2QU68_9HYPH|nr:pentapeptide repeat-containing protein [Rhizobium rhizophilum]THV13746.1 pentapeptide repeat-containing protein [Rhizobium rhizophilum]